MTAYEHAACSRPEMVEDRRRAGGAVRLLRRLQLKPEPMPERKCNHEMLVRLVADPCCLLLIAVGIVALMIKFIQWISNWFK